MCLEWLLRWDNNAWRWSRLLWAEWRASLILAFHTSPHSTGAVHIHSWCCVGVSDMWRHSDQCRRREAGYQKFDKERSHDWQDPVWSTVWGSILIACSVKHTQCYTDIMHKFVLIRYWIKSLQTLKELIVMLLWRTKPWIVQWTISLVRYCM